MRLPIVFLLTTTLTACVGGPPLFGPVTGPTPPAPTTVSDTPLAWEKNHPERAAWSHEVRTQLAAKLPSFETAMTGSEYCPHYASLSSEQKVDVLATMAVAIARWESNYNTKQHFKEPGLGYDSIGLFQLSYEDAFTWCTVDKPSKSLEEPLNNIACAVPDMARLAAKDKIISSATVDDNRGLAHYWSVVRAGPKHKRAEIINATKAAPGCS